MDTHEDEVGRGSGNIVGKDKVGKVIPPLRRGRSERLQQRVECGAHMVGSRMGGTVHGERVIHRGRAHDSQAIADARRPVDTGAGNRTGGKMQEKVEKVEREEEEGTSTGV